MLIPVAERHGGTICKTIGDALTAYFDDPVAAVRAAVDTQRSLDAYNHAHPGAEPMQVRIGLHCGLGLVKDRDVFGDVVNITARLESMARAKSILVSTAVEERIRSSDIPYRKMADVTIKGRSQRWPIFEILWGEFSAGAPPPEPPRQVWMQTDQPAGRQPMAVPTRERYSGECPPHPGEVRTEQRRRVLWLDDTADKTIFARRSLREQGWEVDLATVGITKALLGRYHLIFLGAATPLRARRRLRFLKLITRAGRRTPILIFASLRAAQKLATQTK